MEMWESPAKKRRDFPTFPQALGFFSFSKLKNKKY
jgi:hypothetical protein